MKYLRECLQKSSELSSPGDGTDKQIADLQFAIKKSILQLSNKVRDVGPVLDMIAVFLGNISTATLVARTAVSAVHRTAQIISSISNKSCHKKDFPDAVFHQLFVEMAHPDHEIRVVAHSFFSFQDEGKDNFDAMGERSIEEGSQTSDVAAKQFAKRDSHGHSYSLKNAFPDGKQIWQRTRSRLERKEWLCHGLRCCVLYQIPFCRASMTGICRTRKVQSQEGKISAGIYWKDVQMQRMLNKWVWPVSSSGSDWSEFPRNVEEK